MPSSKLFYVDESTWKPFQIILVTVYHTVIFTCMSAHFSCNQARCCAACSVYAAARRCDSASNNGCTAGGSGNVSYRDEMYVMRDFSSGSWVSTSTTKIKQNQNIACNYLQELFPMSRIYSYNKVKYYLLVTNNNSCPILTVS